MQPSSCLLSPPDKVVVIVREVPLANWGQAGIVATDSDFLVKSRMTEPLSYQKE